MHRSASVVCTVNSLDGHTIPLLVGRDDDIVVTERRIVTAEEYLYDMEETNRIRELAMGVLREPPAPFFSHQPLVLKVARLWSDHVEPRKLGRVAVAPVDVILDRERALIVQPDVLFVSTERLSIINDQVWGAPDLVAEVLSHGTEHHDRGEKLGWYRHMRRPRVLARRPGPRASDRRRFHRPVSRQPRRQEAPKRSVRPCCPRSNAPAFGLFS